MCGFNSAKYFFRCFRVAKGTTPLRYRKNSGKTTTWWL
jgi:transcriptional regulator GlxA family with amidase domain